MWAKIICLILVVKCVSAAPPTDVVPLEKQQPTVIPIVAQSEELESNGTFKYSYETANGIKREETSYDKVLPTGRSGASSDEAGEDKSDESNEIHVQQGSYSYTAPDGTVITVRYIADENGFRPIGDHLPKPPSLLMAATVRNVGRSAKTADNSEGGSAPVPAIASSPKESSKESKAPEVSGRIGISAEVSSSSEGSPNISRTAEALSTTLAQPANPDASITESNNSTTGSAVSSTEAGASTTEAVPSTTKAEVSTTAAVSITSEAPASTTDTTTSSIEAAISTTEATPSITETASSTIEALAITTETVSSTKESASSSESESSTTEQSSEQSTTSKTALSSQSSNPKKTASISVDSASTTAKYTLSSSEVSTEAVITSAT